MKNWNLDKIGMTASGVCAVHCVAVPFLLVMFPFLAVVVAKSNQFEWAFIGVSAIVAFFAMFQGYVYHKRPIPYVLAILGFVVFVVAKLTFEHEHAHTHELALSGFIYVGAGLLVVLAHYLNHKFIQHTKCTCGSHQ